MGSDSTLSISQATRGNSETISSAMARTIVTALNLSRTDAAADAATGFGGFCAPTIRKIALFQKRQNGANFANLSSL